MHLERAWAFDRFYGSMKGSVISVPESGRDATNMIATALWFTRSELDPEPSSLYLKPYPWKKMVHTQISLIWHIYTQKALKIISQITISY